MDILTQLKDSIFQRDRRISPIIPVKELLDVEMGDINTELHKYNLEMKNESLDNPDLELGFGPIVEMNNSHIIIRIQTTVSNKHVIENYYSLFDSLNYMNMNYKFNNK